MIQHRIPRSRFGAGTCAISQIIPRTRMAIAQQPGGSFDQIILRFFADLISTEGDQNRSAPADGDFLLSVWRVNPALFHP